MTSNSGGECIHLRYIILYMYVSDPVQADFGALTVMDAVTTRGNPTLSNYWVKLYTLSYSSNNVTWLDVTDASGNTKVFPGNTDTDSAVINMLPSPLTARYLRLHPVQWQGHISMRWDVSRFRGKLR